MKLMDAFKRNWLLYYRSLFDIVMPLVNIVDITPELRYIYPWL